VILVSVVLAVMLGVVMLAIAQAMRHDRSVKDALRNAVVRDVRALVPGEKVKLIGTAIALGEPLTAPFGGTPCVFYEVSPSHEDQSGRRRQDFYLEDLTGRVLIDTAGAEVLLANLGDVIAPGGRGDLVEQGYIAVGARVAVVGHVELDPILDQTAGAFREQPRNLRIRATIVAADPAQLD
jgi:hypothetical protein